MSKEIAEMFDFQAICYDCLDVEESPKNNDLFIATEKSICDRR